MLGSKVIRSHADSYLFPSRFLSHEVLPGDGASLCCAAGPWRGSVYSEKCMSVNPKLLIPPSPAPYKFVFWVCEVPVSFKLTLKVTRLQRSRHPGPTGVPAPSPPAGPRGSRRTWKTVLRARRGRRGLDAQQPGGSRLGRPRGTPICGAAAEAQGRVPTPGSSVQFRADDRTLGRDRTPQSFPRAVGRQPYGLVQFRLISHRDGPGSDLVPALQGLPTPS